eukprot:1035024-Prymnesium_polylepis.2
MKACLLGAVTTLTSARDANGQIFSGTMNSLIHARVAMAAVERRIDAPASSMLHVGLCGSCAIHVHPVDAFSTGSKDTRAKQCGSLPSYFVSSTNRQMLQCIDAPRRWLRACVRALVAFRGG